MTNSEIAKKAWDLATKESEEKQVQEIKKIVTETLKKLDDVKSRIKELQDEKKILELDIDDLKEGKLDRIEERQQKDPKAKKVSVVVIIKEKETIREVSNPWFIPYRTIWQTEYTNINPDYGMPVVTCDAQYRKSLALPVGDNVVEFSSALGNSGWGTINCSVAKNAAAGAYDVGGHIINLR